MITTITLNPAVDKTCMLPELLPGQINRMKDVKNIAGGKGINVTKILRQYGYPVRALGFLGGYNGRFIEDYLVKRGVDCKFTPVNGETRCNTNVISEGGCVTELLEPGPFISKDELQAFLFTYEEALADSEIIVISGSIPEGVPVTVYGELIQMAHKKGKHVCLDSNKDSLREGIVSQPFMIKPNVKELEDLLHKKMKNRDMIITEINSFLKKGISHVLVSMGAEGLLYGTEGKLLYAKAPEVNALNTVACGDCVVASFVMSLLEKEEKEECLKRAVAISAANATTMESAVIPKAMAKALYENVQIEKIIG